MNPVAAVDAVSREPLATLQALVERLSQPQGGQDAQQPMQAQTADNVLPGLAAALAEAAALSPVQSPALSAAQAEAIATAQAQQGLMTLGQMAQQNQVSQNQTQSATLSALAADPTGSVVQMLLAAPQLASPPGAAAAAGATLLAVPVLMTPLQAQASPHSQRHSVVQPEPARHQGPQDQHDQKDQKDQPHDDPADAEREAAETAAARSAAAAEPANADSALEAGREDTRALRELLRAHGSAAVQRELQAGRRVLVVLPQAHLGLGLVAARAALLGPAGTRLFAHTRWWAGDRSAGDNADAESAAADSAAWPQWRVFREGDSLHAPFLLSRADGHGCRVLLGTPAPRLLDNRSALLELPERLRFVQALGGQWSLLLVVAPPGALA